MLGYSWLLMALPLSEHDACVLFLQPYVHVLLVFVIIF